MTFVNLIITIGDIRISTAGVNTKQDYSLYVLYYVLYGARGIFYAIMAAVDPSFLRAVRIHRGEAVDSSQHSQSCTNTGINVHTETRFEEEFSSARTDLEMQPVGLSTAVVGGIGSDRPTHWAAAASDASFDSPIKESSGPEDTSSVADLTAEAQGDGIEEVRGQQKEHARMRLAVESAFKRQI